MLSDKKFLLSALFLGLIMLLGILAPLLPIADPNTFDPLLAGEPQLPSFQHWFGTDELGRDLFSRICFGARVSLMVGVISVGISLIIGLFLGVVAGYYGGVVDTVIMRLVDFAMAIPVLFLILIIQVQLSPSIWNVMIVIGATSWMGITRLVRAEVLSIKERPFILAAKARGIAPFKLMLTHILPLSITPIIVSAMLGMGGAILTESVLSFLGMGVQPPHASWGNMLKGSLDFMTDAPWLAVIPGCFITATVLALNFIGDGLRLHFNPKERYVRS